MALRSFADGALFAEVLGEGPPRILALHGWGRRGADFKPSLEGLSALAPDLPGFGATPPPSEVIGAAGYADILALLLAEFDEPPVLIGHSFGGRVAMCLADRYPGQVGPLILTGVPLLRSKAVGKPALTYRLVRSLNRLGLVSDEKLEEERRRRGSADYRAATGAMRDILVKVVNETYEIELQAVSQMVMMLWGREDDEVPLAVAERALSLRQEAGLPASLAVVEGVGHQLPLRAPEELRRLAEKVLA